MSTRNILNNIIYFIFFPSRRNSPSFFGHKICKMPIKIKYIKDGVGVEYIGTGVVTGADIIEANKKIYGHENFLRQRYQIVDRTNCKEFRVSSDEILIERTVAHAAPVIPKFSV